MTCPTRLPEPHTIYHRNHPELDTGALRRFITAWRAEQYPVLDSVWRDTGGGWIRWWWFGDKEGMAHALWMPSFRNPQPPLTEDETELLKFMGAVIAYNRNFPEDPFKGGAPGVKVHVKLSVIRLGPWVEDSPGHWMRFCPDRLKTGARRHGGFLVHPVKGSWRSTHKELEDEWYDKAGDAMEATDALLKNDVRFELIMEDELITDDDP